MPNWYKFETATAEYYTHSIPRKREMKPIGPGTREANPKEIVRALEKGIIDEIDTWHYPFIGSKFQEGMPDSVVDM